MAEPPVPILTVRDAGRVLGLSALLAPADPRAIAAFDHAGTRLDDLHSVVLHVVIRLKIRANIWTLRACRFEESN